LLDVPGVALCLPGAVLTDSDGDTHTGTVRIKVGPITTEYAGTVRFVERDDTAYRAKLDATGSETRGAGTASAQITTTLTDKGDHTVVKVETDLAITGKVAQFGRGMIAEIAGNLLQQFAANLEAKLEGTADAAGAPTGESPAAAQAPAVDVLGLATAPVLRRLAA